MKSNGNHETRKKLTSHSRRQIILFRTQYLNEFITKWRIKNEERHIEKKWQ